MAVEHKDDTQPIGSKLKALEAENVDAENGTHNNTDNNKENLQENGNNNNNNQDNHNNTNNNTQDTTTTKDITQTNDTHNNDSNNKESSTEQNQTASSEEAEAEGEEAESQDHPLIEGVGALSIAEPSNFSVKHPLQNSWTIWYDNPGKRSNQASWGDHLKKITTFSTVEDFWRVFNNLKPASALAQGSNYHIFKEYIEPKWEDSANAKGGKWTVSIPPKSRNSSLDQMWLWTVLACIGETFLSPDDVCGMVVSVRKAGDRVQIWTKDANNDQACKDIGQSLKDCLELPANVIIGYQSHADSMKKAAKNRYEV